MAAEVTFETRAQSTGPTIFPELPRILVTFRSTAYLDKLSQAASHDDGLVGRVPIGDCPHKNYVSTLKQIGTRNNNYNSNDCVNLKKAQTKTKIEIKWQENRQKLMRNINQEQQS